MSAPKRIAATAYLDPKTHRAVRRLARSNGTSTSAVINDAIKRVVDDTEKLRRLIREARMMPTRPHEEVEAEFKRDGLL